MGTISAQNSITLNLQPLKTARAKTIGTLAGVALPGKNARLLIRAFNIRNLGQQGIGGHLFPRRRR